MATEQNYSDRFNLHEEKDPAAWKFYKQQLAQRWDPDETVLSEDRDNFTKLNPRYQRLVEDIVAFFAPGDGLVCEQVDQLKAETTDFAQRAFLGEQYSIEVVHARAYKDIIMTFFQGEDQKRIFKSIDSLPCVREKANFVLNYMDNKELPLSLRYLAAAVSEGVFFVSLFAVIFYLKEKKLLTRFCFINEQVSKDEKLHRDFDVMMAKRGKERGEFSEAQAHEVVKHGIKVEMVHIKHILRDPIDSVETDALGGMTVENMHRFVCTLADQIMVGLGYNPHFTYSKSDDITKRVDKVEEYSPPWMKGLSMIRKTNFYESPVGNYTMISGQKTESVSKAFDDLDNLGI